MIAFVRREWQREVDSGFLAGLRAFSPRSETRAWLHVYWEPGDWWQKVERFVVAQVVPRSVLARERDFYLSLFERDAAEGCLFAELEGPNPREGGYFDSVLGKYVFREALVKTRPEFADTERIVPNITQRQWLLWREIGGLAKPVWIVQGKSGGHPRSFNQFQEDSLRLRAQRDTWKGLKSERIWEPAAPGDLPYAPLDTRVIESLAKQARLNAYQCSVRDDWKTRWTSQPETLNDAERALASELDSWCDDRVDDRLVSA